MLQKHKYYQVYVSFYFYFCKYNDQAVGNSLVKIPTFCNYAVSHAIILHPFVLRDCNLFPFLLEWKLHLDFLVGNKPSNILWTAKHACFRWSVWYKVPMLVLSFSHFFPTNLN